MEQKPLLSCKDGYSLILSRPIGTALLTNLPDELKTQHSYFVSDKDLLSDPFPLTKLQSKFAHYGSTDVSGYGLIGHLATMSSAHSARVELNMRMIEEAIKLPKQLMWPQNSSCSAKQNFRDFGRFVDWGAVAMDHRIKLILFQGETNGPLLSIIKDSNLKEYTTGLKQLGFEQYINIGSIYQDFKPTNTPIKII